MVLLMSPKPPFRSSLRAVSVTDQNHEQIDTQAQISYPNNPACRVCF